VSRPVCESKRTIGSDRWEIFILNKDKRNVEKDWNSTRDKAE